MKIVYSKDSLKFLAKVERKLSEQIRNAIKGLTLSPPIGDIKVLKGVSDKRMRLRVGKYRVLFRYDSENNKVYVYVINIDSRGDIYK